jgi:hypothetical protein
LFGIPCVTPGVFPVARSCSIWSWSCCTIGIASRLRTTNRLTKGRRREEHNFAKIIRNIMTTMTNVIAIAAFTLALVSSLLSPRSL